MADAGRFVFRFERHGPVIAVARQGAELAGEVHLACADNGGLTLRRFCDPRPFLPESLRLFLCCCPGAAPNVLEVHVPDTLFVQRGIAGRERNFAVPVPVADVPVCAQVGCRHELQHVSELTPGADIRRAFVLQHQA